MSGGSYQYLYCKEMGARLDGLKEYEEDLKSDLEAAVAAGPQWHDKTKAWTRTITPEEIAACLAAREEAMALVAAAKALNERVERFAGVLQAVEWKASSDWGSDAIWDACVAWAKVPK
jgi:hypothetical protein